MRVIDSVEDIKIIVKAATAKFRESLPEGKEGSTDLEKAVIRAMADIRGKFNYTTSRGLKPILRKIVIDVQGEALKGLLDSPEVEIKKNAMVVPVSNPNSHNYEIGYPVLVKAGQVSATDTFKGITPTIGPGNYLPPYPAVRPATDEEIDSFFDAYTELKGEPLDELGIGQREFVQYLDTFTI